MTGLHPSFKTQIQEAIPFRGQKYLELRESYHKRGRLFEDPCFNMGDRGLLWKRPGDIAKNPKVYVDGASRNDFAQGNLGNCWFLATLAAIADRPELMSRVSPQDQSFNYKYAGIFHFRLWYLGKWFDIVIDDRLPVDSHGNLLFVKSTEKNEFWAPFMEKCYCKLLGVSYENMSNGFNEEALEDFTGGITEDIYVQYAPNNLDWILWNSWMKGSLMACQIDRTLANLKGLMSKHAYTITAVMHSYLPPYGDLTLIRLRNPWGQGEWTGPWCDGSPEWQNITNDIKKKYGLTYKDEGEFWMSYRDFINYFDWVSLCHLTPDPFEHRERTELNWRLSLVVGSWVKGLSDGGIKKLHRNPLVTLNLDSADDSDRDGLCSILIALMQKVKFSNRFSYNRIGVAVHKIDNPSQTIDEHFIKRHKPVGVIQPKKRREVSSRFNLLPGYYCIIPFILQEGTEGTFLLRLFTEKSCQLHDVDDKIGVNPHTTRFGFVEFKQGEDEESLENGEYKVKKIKDLFDKATGNDMEADWHELKHTLDLIVKSEKSDINEESHFLLNISTYLLNFFTRPPPYHSAFETMDVEGFPKDLCRSMISLQDLDHSGKLNFQEFQNLWLFILRWKSIYEIYSNESKGILAPNQLKQALHSAGFKLNQKIIIDLVHRYANKEGNISFDDFLLCILKLTSMFDYLKTKYSENKDKTEFKLQEFISITINL